MQIYTLEIWKIQVKNKTSALLIFPTNKAEFNRQKGLEIDYYFKISASHDFKIKRIKIIYSNYLFRIWKQYI